MAAPVDPTKPDYTYQNPYDDEEMRRLLGEDVAPTRADAAPDVPQAPTPAMPVAQAETPAAYRTPNVGQAAASTNEAYARTDEASNPYNAPVENPWDPASNQDPGTQQVGISLPATPESNPDQFGITPTTPATTDATTTPGDYSQPGAITKWFASKGVTLRPGAEDYWIGKWNEYGKKDTTYFISQMQSAVDRGSELGATDSTAGGYGGGATSAIQAPTLPTWQGNNPAIHQAILDLLAQGNTTPTGNDPTIRAQFNPQSQVIQRNNARAKANSAERAFAQGQTGDGANDVQSQQIDQASGLDEANLMGQLIGNELTARRQQVVQALTLAQGEDRLSLQAYLSQIDAELRKYGIGVQNQQFYDQLGVGIGNQEAQFNQQLLALLAQG